MGWKVRGASGRRWILWCLVAAGSVGFGVWARGEIHRRVDRLTGSYLADARRDGGTLLIAGGGQLPTQVRQQFVELAGGAAARIVVIPAANVDADRLRLYRDVWIEFGPASVEVLHADSRAMSEDPAFSAILDDATGVWLGGGQQTWLTAWYRGTPVQERLLKVLQRGGVVGGSSAGASAMSEHMIAGGRESPITGNGLGLLRDVIVDQHFVRRNRLSRLLKMVERHREEVGLGVDEGTAVVLSLQSGRFSVIGNSCAVACCYVAGQDSPRIEFFNRGDTFDLRALREGAPTLPNEMEFLDLFGD